VKQAYKLCLLGATDKQLADFFEVNTDTIYAWKKIYPEFSESIKRGKSMADAKVAESLYKISIGYKYTVEKVINHNGKTTIIRTKKHCHPNVRACIFMAYKPSTKALEKINPDFCELNEANCIGLDVPAQTRKFFTCGLKNNKPIHPCRRPARNYTGAAFFSM